ncbi:hypothetical protein BH10BDE1_BH10BDE1_03420 [soil metagenome]
MTSNYAGEIAEAAKAQDFEKIGLTINAALKDEAVGEDDLAELATAILNYKVESYFQIFEIFSQRYPDSILPIHAFYSEFLVLSGKTERGAEEARFFLRKMRDVDALKREDLSPFYRDGLARAFLYSQSTYIELGARSYCLRVLAMAKSVPALKDFAPEFEKHIVMITKELEDPDVRTLDGVWEGFFSSGRNLEPLLAICEKLKFAELARRLEILEGQARRMAVLPFEEEFFKIAYTSDKNEVLLQ